MGCWLKHAIFLNFLYFSVIELNSPALANNDESGCERCTDYGNYLGCFATGCFQVSFSHGFNEGYVIDNCTSLCQIQGYLYANVQNETKCECACALNSCPEPNDDSECGLPCPGALDKFCGGKTAGQIYQINLKGGTSGNCTQNQPTAGPTASTGTTPLSTFVLVAIIVSILLLLIVTIAIIIILIVRRHRRVRRYLAAKPDPIEACESSRETHKIELKPRAPIIGTIDYDDGYAVPTVVPAAVTTGRKRSGQAENRGNLLTVDDGPRLPAPTSIARIASGKSMSMYGNSASIVISRPRENLHKEPSVVAPVAVTAPSIPSSARPIEEEPTYENQTVYRRDRSRAGIRRSRFLSAPPCFPDPFLDG